MRAILQRVSQAKVEVAEGIHGQIEHGWMILLGITHSDNKSVADKLAEKICNMRAFADVAGKMNLSILDTDGSILVVSNFTLYADTIKGRRPSFLDAAKPEFAEPLYEHFCNAIRGYGITVATGKFGHEMQITLCNSGPITFFLEIV